MKTSTNTLLLLMLMVASDRGLAGILGGPVTNSANGHFYYLLTQNTWTASQAEAVRLGGSLATINDAAEQEWVFSAFSTSGTQGFWIGLNDLGHEGIFTWVSGEASTYRNWDSGEPNNGGPTRDESFVHMWPVGAVGGVTPGRWNDLPDNTEYGNITLHGVVEVDPGVLEGPFTNAANGHIYYLLTQNTWTASQAHAVRLGGSLVTINDAPEQDWVFTTFAGGNRPPRNLWIGLNDMGHDGLFTWVSGESAGYRNWDVGEPNNGGQFGNESFVHMWAVDAANVTPGRWNDLPDVTEYGSIPLHGIVEVDPALRLSISVAFIELRWPSLPGKVYQLQYTSEATTNLWVDLGQPVAGNGLTNSVLDSAQQTPRRFYRVIVLP